MSQFVRLRVTLPVLLLLLLALATSPTIAQENPPDSVIVSLDIEKFVSVDGITWSDADAAPGPNTSLNTEVQFRMIVTNDGNVPLVNLTLSDDNFDVSGCPLPQTLAPGAFFECVVGPFPAVAGQHINVATATATNEDGTTTAADSDSAHYFGGEPEPEATPEPEITAEPEATPEPESGGDLPVTLVIEGPVLSININIITIYGFEIELAPDDPLLTVIQIGDNIRVSGDAADTADTLIIVAVTIIIVDDDLAVDFDTGEVWRDDGECSNPPPPWAPARGWRAKCERGEHPGGGDRDWDDYDDDDDDDDD